MGAMRISVIIPAHNEEAMIHSTLESLQNQDYRGPVEIIVVDNKSTDNTAAVARWWGARVVREDRKGYIYALMSGFENATGDILITTDADTVVPPNWVSTLVRAFEKDPRVVAAGSIVEFCDANWKGKFFARCILPVALAYDRLCFSYPHLWGASMAVRRDAFIEAGGWTGKFNLHADADLSRRIAKVGKVVMIKGLKVSTSARRFNSGLLANLLVYGGNFLGLQILHRPIFFNFRDARPAVRGGPGSSFNLKKGVAVCSIILAFALWGLSTHARAWSYEHLSGTYIKHVATQEKVIALTFDDGPNEPYTSRVLQILHENGVRATFFLIGENVESFPRAAREIVRQGHVIGNHSYSHPFFLVMEPSGYEARQIEAAERILEKVTGAHCTLFRPPGGFRTPWLLRVAARHGLTAVGWSEDASDWNHVSSAEIAARIIRNAKPGNIILLHDGLNLKHGVDRSDTIKALPRIITTLKARGYRFVTVPELLHLAESSKTS
jgi:peptidoglycan/xylan/chitin deacetylase (PgdA/CDA1 family)/glycosyltransferase involved in cell wall biosynthesis